MTGQIHDKVFYNGTEYDLVEQNGGGLFDPSAFGMFPQMIHTACWRGYYCRYAVERFDLLLTRLKIRTHDEQYPLIMGVSPADDGYGVMYYDGLRLPMEFRGDLVLGAEFIRERYVHMGFQSAQSYQKVMELTFVAGKLISVQDRSDGFAQLR
jgi:hypothetical protein